jgi:aldehyde:ferredoxin oxidoreductase
MPYGYSGNILHVDLNKQKYWIEHPDEKFYRKYWGGRAIALYYMLKEMEPGIDPLSRENLLIYASSVIVGTTAPTVNRFAICAKSPLTGAEGETEAGGFFGPELKKAGFDAIIIKGKAQKPVYLWIKDGQVEIRSAEHLWGKETKSVQEKIREELDDSRVRVALIGPGGENLVKFANIVNELSHFNGRNGLGAVMGSKNLKAVAVRGTHNIEVYDKERIKEITKNISKRAKESPQREKGTIESIPGILDTGWLPCLNFSASSVPEAKELAEDINNKTILKGYDTCYACPIRCKHVVEVDDEGIKVDPSYGGPEYEAGVTLGSICGVYDYKYIAKANELCNKYTVDTISMGMAIGFAMQCYEEGILTNKDTDGIDLKFGNKEALLEMVERIVYRKGYLGNLLAEGTLIASQKIGKGSEKFIHQVKGQEIPAHDPRIQIGKGIQYATADYGADHMKVPHDFFFTDKESVGVTELTELGVYEPVSLHELGEKKVRLYKKLDIYWSLLDILGVCCFGYMPRGLGKLHELMEIIEAVTGWKTSWFELMQVGERSINMAHIFNIREGFSPRDDTLPEIFYQNFNKGPLDGTGAVNKKDFEEAIKMRYEIMDWNKETGIPERGKLIDLDLSWTLPFLN